MQVGGAVKRSNCNPYLPIGLFHPYQLDVSISKFRGVCFFISFRDIVLLEIHVSKQCRPWVFTVCQGPQKWDASQERVKNNIDILECITELFSWFTLNKESWVCL